jgi:hypothetical protein
MALPPLFDKLRLPAVGAPQFIIANPELVIAQCTGGIVGGFPALNARPQPVLDDWLHRIKDALAEWDETHPDAPAAPYAVNQIVHKTNARLEEDVAMCVKHKVPVVITSLGARPEVNEAIHSYGGIVLHDAPTASSPSAPEQADTPAVSRRSRSSTRSANSSMARSCSQAPSRQAKAFSPRRRWAPISPTWARPSLRRRKPTRPKRTSR